MEDKNFVIYSEFDERVKEVAITLLTHVVNEGEVIPYGDLSKKLSFEPNPRNIEKYLGYISYDCRKNGLPEVSVMVVNKETLMPGMGFFSAYYPQLKTLEEQWTKCFELMDSVKKYNRWDRVLEAYINW